MLGIDVVNRWKTTELENPEDKKILLPHVTHTIPHLQMSSSQHIWLLRILWSDIIKVRYLLTDTSFGEKKGNIIKLYTTYIYFLCIHCLSEFIFFTVYCCLLFSMALNYKCSHREAGTNDCSCRDVNTKWQRNKLKIPLA